MPAIPRFVIAGAHSGAGKTSVALAVVAGLTRRGLRVQTFKVGPDFLDPGHLAAVSGRPCYNLDGWMCDRRYVAQLFRRVTADADVAVIEGVMGLFDGASMHDIQGSTAEIAAWLQAPVMLVVDTGGMAGSLAAVAAGFTGFEKDVHVAGVVANFCGSRRHGRGLARALAARPQLPPLVGAVPAGALPHLPSRHLGLVSADPAGRLCAGTAAALADAAESCIDLDRICSLGSRVPSLRSLPARRARSLPMPCRLAVARDRAFHFYYQDLFDELAARGCDIIFFSPLEDRTVPDGSDGLYLGGGYPEEFAAQLSANTSMRQSIGELAASGRPLYAECGGLIYLSRSLTTLDGACHPMLGLLPADTRMLPKRKFLGYVQAKIESPSLWGLPGERLRGHEFHYSELTTDPGNEDGWQTVYRLNRRRKRERVLEGYQCGNILASYVHLHLAGHPAAMDRFLNQCIETKQGGIQ
jgi:cobyrinic acid a,c-diamide synthase